MKFKKVLSVMLSAFMLTSVLGANAFAESSGSGTAADPIIISDAASLKAFRDSVNNGDSYAGKYIKLNEGTYDISGEEWTPIGNGTRKSAGFTGNSFSGIIDCNNAVITGLTMQNAVSNEDDAIGLFGVVSGGTVKNLTLENVNINVSNSECAGGAIGLMTNNSVADNITVSGAVSAVCGNAGIAGRMIKSGTISDCVNYAVITANGKANVGGIVGAAYYTEVGSEMNITNCSNDGAVTSTKGVAGGIVGLSAANVSNCSNSAPISANGDSIGGIVGEQQNYGTVKACTNTAEVTDGANGYGTGGIIGWLRYNGAADNYPLKKVIEVLDNRNSSVVNGGAVGGGIVGTAYNAAVVKGNENTAPTIKGNSFAGGIVGNLQATETPVGNIPMNNINVSGNASSTTIDNITGGCKDLYAYKNNNEFVVTENSDSALVEVGGVGYIGLRTAIAAAKDGDTITLLSDMTINATVEVDKTLTLDLNGYTMKNNVEANYMISVIGTASFTVDGTKDGSRMITPKENTKAYGFVKITPEADGAVLTINGGTYEGDTDNANLFRHKSNSKNGLAHKLILNMNNVTATTNGGVFNVDTSLETELNIIGGTFTSTQTPDGSAGNEYRNIFGTDTYSLSPVLFKGVTINSNGNPCIEVCGSSATFEDCNFNISQSNGAWNSTAIAVSWGGEASIKGGTYTSTAYGAYIYTSGGIITIEDGTVSGGVAAVMSSVDSGSYPDAVSNIYIKGGNIIGKLNTNNNANANITVSGGTFTVDVTDYLDENLALDKNEDGTFIVVSKPTATWEYDTDAGYYLDADVKKGLMRFLFNIGLEGTVEDSGIKYIKGDNLAEPVYAAEATGEPAKAFFGDVINIPESADGTYYAVAYVKIDGQTYWSNPLACSPSFDKYFSSLDR